MYYLRNFNKEDLDEAKKIYDSKLTELKEQIDCIRARNYMPTSVHNRVTFTMTQQQIERYSKFIIRMLINDGFLDPRVAHGINRNCVPAETVWWISMGIGKK
jgi:hypothetical protein